MKNAIEVRGLRKHYGSRSVLRGVDLTIPRGEIFALLGVNGAGKTTTLECMEGLKRMTAGRLPWTEGPAFSFRPLLCRNT